MRDKRNTTDGGGERDSEAGGDGGGCGCGGGGGDGRFESEQLYRNRRLHVAVFTLCVPLLVTTVWHVLPPPSLVLWESIWLYKFFVVALSYRSSPALYTFNTVIQSILVEKMIFGVSWRGLLKDFLARSSACFAAMYLCEKRSVDRGVSALVQVYSLSLSWLATLSYVFVWQNFFQLTTAVSPFVVSHASDPINTHRLVSQSPPQSPPQPLPPSTPNFLLLTKIASALRNIDSIYEPKYLLFLILGSGIAATSLALRECHGRALLFSLLYYSRCLLGALHSISAPAWMILCVFFAHIFHS